MDVSNNAFNHGIFIINYLKNIDYLYVHNIEDIFKIRRLNKDIKIIYKGEINEDNIYDLVVNDVIIILDQIELLKKVNIKDECNLIIDLNKNNYKKIREIKEFIDNNKYYKIIGLKAKVTKKSENNFREILNYFNNKDLIIINNEENINELGNALKVDNSIYGINKRKLLKKKEYKQIFSLNTKIVKIARFKKRKNLATINFGYLQGMKKEIKKVFIKDTLYDIKNISADETTIIVDKKVKLNDKVEITSSNNPLDNYFKEANVSLFNLFNNINIVYDEEMWV